MNGTDTFQQPRRILSIWLALLITGAILLACGGWLLHRTAASLRDSSAWTYLKEAERLKDANLPLEALKVLEHAATVDPASPVPHEEMGRLYYTRLSDWSNALEAYRRALERGSLNAEVRGKAMWCLIHLGRNKDAAEFGQACIEQGYDAPDFHRYIAEAYRRAGMHEESIPYFEKAVASFPGDVMLMERLMQAYGAVGNKGKQLEMRQRIERNEG